MLTSFLVLISLTGCLSALTAVSSPIYNNITDGVPLTDSVINQQIKYYRFVSPLPLPRTDIVLSPLFGSFQLLLTLGPFWDPEPGNAEWTASTVTSDALIQIPYNATFSDVGNVCNIQRNVTKCVLNIGIVGIRGGNYTLSLTTSLTAGILQAGVPRIGRLPPDLIDYYNFTVPYQMNNIIPLSIIFRLSPASGNVNVPDIFVSSQVQGYAQPDPGQPLSYCAYAIDPPGTSGVEIITLTNTSSCVCTGPSYSSCTFYIAVSNPSSTYAADYTLTALTSSSPYTLLTDGIALSDTGSVSSLGEQFLFIVNTGGSNIGNPNNPMNYNYPSSIPSISSSSSSSPFVTVANGGRIEIVVTPTIGTVRVYAYLSSSINGVIPPGPDSAYHYSSGGNNGVQLITISPTDRQFTQYCNGANTCNIFIGVWTTSLSSSWNILVQSTSYLVLTSGMPQSDTVPIGTNAVYFRYPVYRGDQAIVFTASPFEGDLSMYIGCDSNNVTIQPINSNPSSYIWSSTVSGDQVVYIDPTIDSRGCTNQYITPSNPCNYYIGIVSNNPTRSVGFTILVHVNGTANVPTPLVLGDTLMDAVPPLPPTGGSTFNAQLPFAAANTYSLAFPSGTASIHISVYTLQGIVGLYAMLGNQSSVPLLSPGNVQYSSFVRGTGTWEGFQISITDLAWNNTPVCYLSNNVNNSCVVYITVANNITIGASQFLLQSTSTIRQIVDGIAVQGLVQQYPAVTYYRYLAVDNSPFTVTVTPISGDPDLFVAVNYLPNVTTSQWSSYSPTAEFIQIQWTEPWIDPNRNPGLTFPVTFNIGVSGYDDSCSYSILVNSNPYLTLSSGIPQAIQTKGQLLQYFLFPIPSIDINGFTVGFSVAITSLTGDLNPYIFVNTVNTTTKSCAHCGYPYCIATPCTLPTVTQYNRRWSSYESADPLLVEVDVADPYFESGVPYIIAVYTAVDSTIEITATYSDAIATLQDQVPTTGQVNTGSYTYYVLDITNVDVNVMVSLTMLAGNADLFVSVNSTNRRPTVTNYDQAVYGSNGNPVALIVNWANLFECPNSSVADTIFCHLYIGVYGDTSTVNETSVYTIVADAARPNSTALLLLDGVPSIGVVRPADYNEYYAIIDVPSTVTYSVTLNPYGTAKLDLYVTTDGTRPSPSNYNFASVGTNGPEQVTIAPGMTGYNNSCKLRIIVHCPFQGWVGYDVVFETSAVSQLLPSFPEMGNVQTTQSRFYSLTVPNPGPSTTIDISFTGNTGLRPIVTVGIMPPGNTSWRPLPGDPSTCTVQSLGGGSRNTEIHYSYAPGTSSNCICTGSCIYMVGVQCPGIPYWNPTCQYILVSTTNYNMPIVLTDGQPLYHSVPGTVTLMNNIPGYRLFTFDMTTMILANGNVTIAATVQGNGGLNRGTLQIVATNQMVGGSRGQIIPNPSIRSSYAWNSNTTGPNGPTVFLSISTSDWAIQQCLTCTVLTIAVYDGGWSTGQYPPSAKDVNFLISATSTFGAPTRLSLGSPSTPVTANYKDVHRFLVFLASISQDLVIDTTVLSGLAAISVDPFDANTACSVGRPPARVIQCTGLWSSIDAMVTPEIRISPTNPCQNANSSLPVPCNATTVWRLGPYYISGLVYWSPTTYYITASQPGMIIVLTDGEPYDGATSFSNPAYLSFAIAGSVDNLSPIRFVLTAPTYALTYYISQCSYSTCTNVTAYPGPSSPPGIVQITGTVLKQTTTTITITSQDPGFCSPSNDPNGCIYFISIYPPSNCDGSTCGADYTVIGSIVTGGNPITIPWNLISNSVYTVGGIVTPPSSLSSSSSLSSGSTAVEVYLSPFSTGAMDVRFTLEACGPVTYIPGSNRWQGLPAIYLCDPSIAAPLGCTNPYTPGPGSQSSTLSGSTATMNGRVTLSISQTSASILYVSVMDSTVLSSLSSSRTLLPIVSPTFSLSVSAYGNTPYLVAGNGASSVKVTYLSVSSSSSSLLLSSSTTENIRLSWDPAQIVVYDNSSPNITAVGVRYVIYLAADGFNTQYLPQTVCGLQNWANINPSSNAVILYSNSTFIDINGLSSVTGEFQVNVLAICDSTCWMLTYPTVYQNFSSLQTQQAVYLFTTFNASHSIPSNNAGSPTTSIVIIGTGVGIGSIILVCSILMGIGYSRRRNGQSFCCCCNRTAIPGNAGLLVIAEDEKDYFLQQQQQLSSSSSSSSSSPNSGSLRSASSLPSSSPVYPVGRDIRVAQLRESIGSTPNFSARNTPYSISSTSANTVPNLTLSPPLLSLNNARNEYSSNNGNNQHNTYVPPSTPPFMSLSGRS